MAIGNKIGLNKNKEISVNTLSDFPAPSGGVITLEAGVTYNIGDNISTSDRFVFGDETSISGASGFSPTLTYTGIDTMFTGVDVNAGFVNVNISAPNGKVWDFSETVGGTKIFALSNCIVDSCDSIGNFSSLSVVDFLNATIRSTNQGIVFAGTGFTITSFTKFSIISTNLATFKGIDFGSSVHQYIKLHLMLIVNTNASAYGISGLTSSGNIVVNSLATIDNVSFLGGMNALENITVNDVRWRFTSNSKIQDTKEDCMLSLNANATATTISVTGTPVLVAGTWVVERQSFFTGTTGGRATYNGERNLVLPIDITCSVNPSSGTNKIIAVYLAKNGTFIPNSKKSIRVDSGDPKNITVFWQLQLVQNDYLEVYIANDTDTTNVVVTSAILRVR